MPRLSDTQTMLLSAAAVREYCSLLPPPETLTATGEALARALSALVKRGLAAKTRARTEAATWRRGDDEARVGLVITAAGLAATGVEDAEAGAADRREDAKADEVVSAVPSRPGGKLGAIPAVLEAEDGATIGELAAAAAWQPHTTRAALTRLRRRGFDIRLTPAGYRKAYQLHVAG